MGKELELTMKHELVLQTLRPTDHNESAGDTGMHFILKSLTSYKLHIVEGDINGKKSNKSFNTN